MAGQDPGDRSGIAARLHRLVRAGATGLGMAGVAVTLRSTRGDEVVAAASDPGARRMAELGMSVGEGPAHDSFAQGRPVLVDELGVGRAPSEWPGYTPVGLAAGIAAVFAFPLQLGASRFGVLNAFDASPRRLTGVDLARCLAFASLATEMLLDSAEASHDGEIDPDLKGALDFRSEIYQAQGMVMVTHRCTLPEALALMRAHAFTTSRPLLDVSVDIVERRLDLAEDG